MCGKKAISVRRIYAGGRKQGHVAMGCIFQFPQTLVTFQSDSQYVVMLHFNQF